LDLSLIVEINIGLLTASSIVASLITYKPNELAEKEYFPIVLFFYWVSSLISTFNLLFIVCGSRIFSYQLLTLISLFCFFAASLCSIFLPRHFKQIFNREITFQLPSLRKSALARGEDYRKMAWMIALILMGAGLLLFQIPFLLRIEFPMDLPAVFVIPPPYSPRWLPIVDGVILEGETVKALGLAVVGTSLGFLLARRYVRPLSLAFSAFVLWNLKFIVEVHPGDHELIRPYILIALLLALAFLIARSRDSFSDHKFLR